MMTTEETATERTERLEAEHQNAYHFGAAEDGCPMCAADAGEPQGATLDELYATVGRLIAEGEGHRRIVFLDADGPEIWAVTSEVDDAIPGLLFVADVDVTGGESES
jgi:hypothetical protein